MKNSIINGIKLLLVYLGYLVFRDFAGIFGQAVPGHDFGLLFKLLALFLIGPFCLSILFTGRADAAENRVVSALSMLRHGSFFYMRFLIVGMFFQGLTLVMIVVSASLLSSSIDSIKVSLAAAVLQLPVHMLQLFLLSAIVTERRRIVPSLWSAATVLFRSASARRMAFIYAVANSSVSLIFAGMRLHWLVLPTGLELIQSLISAGILFSAIPMACRAISGYFIEFPRPYQGRQPVQQNEIAFDDDWIESTSFYAGLLSFLPPINLIAVALGLKACKTTGKVPLRAYGALVCGGSFTVLQILLLLGVYVLPQPEKEQFNFSFLARDYSVASESVQLLQTGSFERAEAIFQEALKTNPDEGNYLGLAIAQLGSGDYYNSHDNFLEAEKKGALSAETLYLRGRAMLGTGQIASAKNLFLSAKKMNSDLKIAGKYAQLTESGFNPSKETNIAWTVGLFIILLSFHEFAHAYVSAGLGDNTAKNEGRLTLDPTVHVDILGSIILPAFLMFRNGSVIGWAKPVPVDLRNLKDPDRDHMRIAVAGPAMNFSLSLIIFVLLMMILVLIKIAFPSAMMLNIASPGSEIYISGTANDQWAAIIILFLRKAMFSSMFLGFFNLLPIGPLDGHQVLRGLLPREWHKKFDSMQEYHGILFLLLIFTPLSDYLMALPYLTAMKLLDFSASTIGFQ